MTVVLNECTAIRDGVNNDGKVYHLSMTRESELKKLGENIARIRHKKGISQDNLAYEAEVGPRTVSRIEVGEVDARFSTLSKLAKALGVKVKDLVDIN